MIPKGVSRRLQHIRFVDVASAVVISSLGFFINFMYFTFEYFEKSSNIQVQIWAELLEYILVLSTIPLYLAIGYIYWREKNIIRELEVSNEMKDIFTDIICHDLINPATAEMNMAKIALENEDDPDKRKILKVIHKSSKRIIHLIESAFKLAKLESDKRLEVEEGDLGAILRRAAEEMTKLADEKNVKIKITAKRRFPALVNPLIQDIFSNLISNAIKYGPEDSEVVVGVEDAGAKWKVSVADKGEGIPDEDKEGVFERFKRREKKGVKGIGLGLAIAKKVVEAHNGRVWVEDNPGGGSVFYVTIPKSNGSTNR